VGFFTPKGNTMPGPITEFAGTTPALNQTQPEFDQNTQDLIDWVVQLPTEINAFSEDLTNLPTSATSTTSNTIGTGSKAFTIQTGKGIFPGQSMTIARTAAPANRMFVLVDSYNSGTGALVVTSQAFEGSGTFTDWTITLGFNAVIAAGQLGYNAVNGQTAETAPATDDELLLGDTSGSALRKMTLANMLKVLDSLTEDTAPDRNADYALTYDASALAVKKVLLEKIGAGLFSANGTALSGTSVNFTGISSSTTAFAIAVTDLSSNGTSVPLIQLGDAGGIENTGYSGSVQEPGTATVNLSAGFAISNNTAAASLWHGIMLFVKISGSSNTWAAIGVFAKSDSAALRVVAGTKALSATLDRARITMTNGTDAFDGGTANLFYP
jgi:hypothetical protein